MRIAIVGTGISGLTAAHRLHPKHDITLFEANDYIGGHTATIDVETDCGIVPVDTGFIVFNDRTYPHFCQLLDSLEVESQDSSMSFSVRCDRTGLEYRGADPGGLFAQRRNLLRPRFWKLLRDLVTFRKKAAWLLESDDETLTVEEFFQQTSFSDAFVEHYFLPMGSAVWSCPARKLRRFPMRFVLQFYDNHGLLGVSNRPQWKVIRGGSKSYIEPLTRPFADRIRLSCPVRSIQRGPDSVVLQLEHDTAEFDHVVIACHSDQALRLLDRPTPIESVLLGAFEYQPNQVVLHTDTSILPRTRRAWACWNYHLPQRQRIDADSSADADNDDDRDGDAVATVTYNMNMLQSLDTAETYCVTLNETGLLDPAKVLRSFVYEHPVFTAKRASAQARHQEVIDQNRTSFCGAYWRNGFHEDGVRSAMAVCETLSQAGVNEKLHI